MLLFIVITVGFEVLVAPPVQLLNMYPALAVAVKVTFVPATYCVPLLQFGVGLALTLPAPEGLTRVVSV